MLESEIKKLTTAVVMLTETLITQGGSTPLPALQTSKAAAPAASKKTSDETVVAAPAAAAEVAPPAVAEVAAPAAVAVPSAEAVVVSAPAADVALAEYPQPTKKQMVDKFILLAQEKDRTVAIALLADFGVAKLPDLKDKATWGPFVAKIDAILAA